jgi:hypothetical protein
MQKKEGKCPEDVKRGGADTTDNMQAKPKDRVE